MFLLQLGVVLFPQGKNAFFLGLRPWILITTYLMLIAFLCANRGLPGMKAIMMGGLLNLIVITANGGYMPVTSEALERSGHLDLIYLHGDEAFVLGSKDIVQQSEETQLALLSDVISTPDGLPIQATMSPGDILIIVGAAWLTYRALLGQPELRRENEISVARC
jgi:hypothetical protein